MLVTITPKAFFKAGGAEAALIGDAGTTALAGVLLSLVAGAAWATNSSNIERLLKDSLFGFSSFSTHFPLLFIL